MRNKNKIWLVCLCVLSIGGCVSKSRFNSVSNDYRDAQCQVAAGEKERSELLQTIALTEKAHQECLDVQKDLKGQLDNIDTENNALLQKIQVLDQTVKNNETVISIQETVIRLFDDSKQTLQTSIKEQIASQKIAVPSTPAPAKLVLVNRLLFRFGSAELSDDAKKLLAQLTGLLQDKRYAHIRVEGHSDDIPVKSNSAYADNWELSVLRATAVVQFLQNNVGIDPNRLSASGFGHYRPIASNETTEGRHQNRRIEIILEADKEK